MRNVAHTRVRKVRAVRPKQDSWHDSWLEPLADLLRRSADFVLGLVGRSASKLVARGGVACILSGGLWIAVVAYLQMLDMGVVDNSYFKALFYIAPLLFMLDGLLAVYALNMKAPGRLGSIGVWLSALGIGIATWQNFDYFWLGQDVHLVNMLGRDFYLINIFYSWPIIAEWFFSMGLGLFIFTLGITTLSIANLRTRALPKQSMLYLAATSIAMTLNGFVPIMGYIANDIVYWNGLFAITLMLFGIGWIWLGVSLLKFRTKVVNQAVVMQV